MALDVLQHLGSRFASGAKPASHDQYFGECPWRCKIIRRFFRNFSPLLALHDAHILLDADLLQTVQNFGRKVTYGGPVGASSDYEEPIRRHDQEPPQQIS